MNLPEYQLKTSSSRRRLGEVLLAEQLLTAEQLNEAIEYQCIYGGRLGTSLVELGFVSEEKLAQVLSQQLKLHYIKPDQLMNVPREIINLVPRKLALKYRIVPYYKENRRLFIAMNDANNLADIDQLAFQLDHIIIPLAIPEVRLMLALHEHYGVELSPRFAAIASQLGRQGLRQEQAAEAPAEVDEPATGEENWPLLDEEELGGGELAEDVCYEIDTTPSVMSYASLCQQLASASDRDDIAQALITYLSQEFSCCALLMVRHDSVSGWLARCPANNISDFAQFGSALQKDSVFSQVVRSHRLHLGPLQDTAENRRFLDCLQTSPSQPAFILPIMVRDRAVCILYVQDSMTLLEQQYASLQSIATKMEMAFTMLILKNKILTT